MTVGVLIGGSVIGSLTHSPSATGLAANATPPDPPTFVPTPIGGPPGPPTPFPTTGPAPTATIPAGVTPTAVAATPVPTVKPVAVLDFSLDAARVSKIHNPGNLQGLQSVKRGSTVELMMYYTLKRLPKTSTRITTYEVDYGGKPVFKVAYKGTEKRSTVGRFSRYALYAVPKSLPYGQYVYRATLTIHNRSQSQNWKFMVGKQSVVAHANG